MDLDNINHHNIPAPVEELSGEQRPASKPSTSQPLLFPLPSCQRLTILPVVSPHCMIRETGKGGEGLGGIHLSVRKEISWIIFCDGKLPVLFCILLASRFPTGF